MLPFTIWTHLLSFLSLASAANLTFYTPNFDAAPENANGLPYFAQDKFVTISWYTSFVNTTLTVFQELGNGTVLWELLAVNWPKSKTEQVWAVKSIGNHSIAGSKFYFFLQNSKNSYCTSCNLTSPHFAIKAELSAPTTTTATTSQTSLAAGTSTANPTTHTTSATSPPPHRSGTVVGQAIRPLTAGNLKIELGVGIGAGIPAALALVGIFFLWIRHRRDVRRSDEEQKMIPAKDEEPRAGTTPMRERDSHMNRESGALGPNPQNRSPTWDQQEAREQDELQQQYQGRQRRASSTRQMPFRPSLGAHSEVDDEGSRQSLIDEFGFERPGYRDSDERSIRAAPRRSWHAPSQSSVVDVANLPPMPQPVHQYYPDRRWPGR